MDVELKRAGRRRYSKFARDCAHGGSARSFTQTYAGLIPYLLFDLVILYPFETATHDICEVSCDSLWAHSDWQRFKFAIFLRGRSIIGFCGRAAIPGSWGGC